ncbi:MAG: ABC transporter ATP-binding protein [Candidatus Magasanikbacteria bacterium]
MKKNNSYIKDTLKIYWHFLMNYKVTFFLVLFGILISSAGSTIAPLYLKRFIDLLAEKGDIASISKQLFLVLFIILFIRFVQFIGYRFVTFGGSYFQSKTMADLYNYAFANLHLRSFSYFNNNFVGSLVKRVGRFVRSFEMISDRIIFNISGMIIEISIIVGVLFYRNFYLGLALLVWILIYSLVNYIFIRYKLKFDVARSEADSAVSGLLADTITNNANVKLFTGYQTEKKSFFETVNKFTNLQYFSWKLSSYFDTAQGFLSLILEVGLMYIGILLWQKGLFSVGDFMMIQAYVISVILNIWNFGRIINHVYSDLSEASEMTEMLLTPLEIIDIPKAKDLLITSGEIRFEEVSFNYHKTREVLNNFELTIKPGERVALIGPSGAGKSTIIKLLLRMHDVTSGKILIDNQNIAKVKQESLWSNISLVPQDPILFHRSLRENIRYGKFDATDDEIFAAAKAAHCDKFISQLPKGYDTFVGERGLKLSGGERQRVAIARAILKNAPILLLDEATSSLDSESEHLIQDALEKLMKDKTVVVVAHRLSTIMSADRIVVLDKGKISEIGNHEKLSKKKGGLYKKLWDLQAGGFIK